MGREIHHQSRNEANPAIIHWNHPLSSLEKPIPKLSIVAFCKSNSIKVRISKRWLTLAGYYENWLMRTNVQIE